ncbi:hypothetical protein FRC96_04655 [Lujinxingia vulgaris]|uniref:HTH crp-type domain-containing protein n=1 Tax=Lujinxingia vulgaris TaxID=2600176 RepID=A0A5C6XR41_9DELT|nr:hypothetical protein [Lujinxingia vulgaris]TXD41279.1 hypothetical protein FRC96_04655 [Lujinxingia vulgaris]
MPALSDREVINSIQTNLARLLGVEVDDIHVFFESPDLQASQHGPAIIAEAAGFRFDIIWKTSASLPSVASGIDHLKRMAYLLPMDVIPLLVVPYMTSTGAQRCEDERIPWLDLSGNAHIIAPKLRLHVEGKSNQFTRRGRPPNVFAPKSSRITRHVLRFPERTFLQKEIAEATGLSEGYTSRVVSRLESLRLLHRDEAGAVGASDPALLLDSWLENYRFDKHRIRRGTVAARSGPELMERVAEIFHARKIDYALTGLSGAWLVDGFANFRTATFYLRAPLGADDEKALRFHEGQRGANLWLVTPNDEGVFQGAKTRNGFEHVHPIQMVLDLKDHPERSAEAAEHLRQTLFP